MRTFDFVAAQKEHAATYAPPVRSLMDIDFYKFTMGQLIFKLYRSIREVEFKLIVRDATIPVGGIVDIAELERALEHVRSLRFSRTDLSYLRGMDVYGKNMFSEEYLSFLKNFRLPPYKLSKNGADIELSFKGEWHYVSPWETIALAIVSELYYRARMRLMKDREIDILYARAKDKLYRKFERLLEYPDIRFADFGQRRRHSFLWQEYAIGLARDMMGSQFTGTSNTWMAFHHDLVPIGTNAHELPMVHTALAYGTPDATERGQYDVLEGWQELYGDGLRIMLPDTYGTDQFLDHAPEWLTSWKGFRQDSGDPITRGERYIGWLKSHSIDPREKLIIFSDGLDVEPMIKIADHFRGRINIAFGWGTNLTNDFRGCYTGDNLFRPISMVCKVVSANGKPVVKLSDNVSKATGPKEEVERYKKIFGDKGRIAQDVLV